MPKRSLLVLPLAVLVVAGLTSGSQIQPPQTVYTPARSIAALGDSISQAANACAAWQNCPDDSWSTGTNPAVNSQATRLQAMQLSHDPIKLYNDAVSGSNASEFIYQAELATTQKPEYITVLVGANDACAYTLEGMTSTKTFKQEIVNGLNVLERKLPNSKIFVSSIPNLKNLWMAGHTNPAAIKAWSAGKVCQSMLKNSTSLTTDDITRRNKVEKQVIKYNKILKAECEQSDNCLFSDALFNHNFTLNEISTVDYFHPNAMGQKDIAEITWASEPYDFTDIARGGLGYKNPNAPLILVIHPKSKESISGTDFTVIAKIESKRKLDEVYVNTQLGKFPLQHENHLWKLSIDTTRVPNGTSTSFTVVAVDDKGNVAASQPIKVTIQNKASTANGE
jgi:lysophospholipase L1-like esterase